MNRALSGTRSSLHRPKIRGLARNDFNTGSVKTGTIIVIAITYFVPCPERVEASPFRSTGRFMESPLSLFFRMRWDHEPVRPRARRRPRPRSQAIRSRTRTKGRFMGSPHDFFVAHWDHEPDWTISCRICNTNLSERFVRFMGRRGLRAGSPRIFRDTPRRMFSLITVNFGRDLRICQTR